MSWGPDLGRLEVAVGETHNDIKDGPLKFHVTTMNVIDISQSNGMSKNKYENLQRNFQSAKSNEENISSFRTRRCIHMILRVVLRAVM